MDRYNELVKWFKNDDEYEIADAIEYKLNFIQDNVQVGDEDDPTEYVYDPTAEYTHERRDRIIVHYTKNAIRVTPRFMVREYFWYVIRRYPLECLLPNIKFIVGSKCDIGEDMEKYSNLIHLSHKEYYTMALQKRIYSIDVFLYNFFKPVDGDYVIRDEIKKMLIELILLNRQLLKANGNA